ncbi:MAG: ANTAR domain-containing protein [Clostridiales bacterium]|nr:ANTAR domain-containing protein [Clostridiales bacterium]
MLRVLVVSDRHGPNGCLCALIRAAGDMEPLCEGGEAAAAFLCGEAFPVAVVDLRPGGEAESLLRRAAEEGCAVALVPKSRLAALVAGPLPPTVLLLEEDAAAPAIVQALRFAAALKRLAEGWQARSAALESRLDEAGLLARAKIALVQYLHMTEPQAHRYIEKQAMDQRVTRAEVARNILKNYSPPSPQ